MSAPDPLLTKADVAALLRCSERTIERLVKSGDFPPSQRFGKEALWFESVVHGWLAHRRKAQHQWLEEHCLRQAVAGPEAPEAVASVASVPTERTEVSPKLKRTRAKEWHRAGRQEPCFQIE